MSRGLLRVAMVTAAIMLAHQVAAKALRDTAFLTSWPATALPLMTVATAAFTGLLVPVFSRLLARFSPVTIVALGFVLSAGGHVLEWMWYDAGRWTSVIIYLHLAGAGSVLLSGFWSLIAERFDPAIIALAQQVFQLFDLGWIRRGQVCLFSRIRGEVVELRRGVVAELGIGVRVDASPVVRLDVLPSSLP